MLAPAQRLRRRGEFSAVIRAGRRAGRGGVVVHLDLPDDAEPIGGASRAGFVVSRAVGTAVTRNKVRRRLRHLVRERLDQLPAGTSVVIRVMPEAAGRSYAELGADLDAALRAARTRRTGRPVSEVSG